MGYLLQVLPQQKLLQQQQQAQHKTRDIKLLYYTIHTYTAGIIFYMHNLIFTSSYPLSTLSNLVNLQPSANSKVNVIDDDLISGWSGC